MKIQIFSLKTRPVTDCYGSVIAIYSKWLDYWMGELCKNLPTKLRDSQDLLDRIKTLGHLPHGARLFTATFNEIEKECDMEGVARYVKNEVSQH